MKLKDLIIKANKNFEVIWHFNVSEFSMIKAIFDAAYELKRPIIIGVSEGERKFFGTKQIKAIIESFKNKYNFPIFLNADHCHSFDSVKEAIDSGFDAVIFDGTTLSFEENISQTRQVVEYARSKNPDILIEAELGYIGKHSGILHKLPEGVNLDKKNFTTPEQALKFINQTGIDLFSPFVGNIHGIILNNDKVLNSAIDIEQIEKIKNLTNFPLVLHGGSGILEQNFILAVKAGINIIHISTELRLAWFNSLKKFIENNPNEITPYKVLNSSYENVYQVVLKYLKLI
ncbi:MAG: class II fructose-bisphosphate aldolase [Patescibacteria group bacterium]|nr:class II fructose-bisphosphate aldolase [Patescibacteria group bacterium]